MEDLALTADERGLVASLLYLEGLPSGTLTWDLISLIQAAEERSLAKQNVRRPIPFDRSGTVVANQQVPAVKPVKNDLGNIVDLASSGASTAIYAGEVRNGDISRLDLGKIIAHYLGTTPDKVTGFNQEETSLDAGSEGVARIVTYNKTVTSGNQTSQKTIYVSGDKRPDGERITWAGAANYGGGTFEDSGVLVLSPTLSDADMTLLRAGKTLPTRDIDIRVNGLTVNGKSADTFIVRVRLNDFLSKDGRVFFGDRPLDDPGYHSFAISNTVGASQPVNSQQRSLDVWRVEQRLKYFGFAAIGSGYASQRPNISLKFNTLAENVSQEIYVTGDWRKDRSGFAAQHFDKVVNYGYGANSR
jgi:hypothetical protein